MKLLSKYKNTFTDMTEGQNVESTFLNYIRNKLKLIGEMSHHLNASIKNQDMYVRPDHH